MPKTKGITLLAIGDRAYYGWAYQMAMSIRFHSPGIPIQLIHCANPRLEPHHRRFFDVFTQIDREDYMEGKRIAPGKAKLSLYKYLAFDHTVYLDSDGLAIKDIEPLFKICGNKSFGIQYVDEIPYQEGLHKNMLWATIPEVFEKFGLKHSQTIYATNASFMFIKKGRKCETLYKRLRENYDTLRIKQANRWGKTPPDELFMNGTLAQLKMTIDDVRPVYFRMFKQSGQDHRWADIVARHFILGCWGDDHLNHRSVGRYYDNQVELISREMLGKRREFKFHYLISKKYVVG